jgi:hypothetical protein
MKQRQPTRSEAPKAALETRGPMARKRKDVLRGLPAGPWPRSTSQYDRNMRAAVKSAMDGDVDSALALLRQFTAVVEESIHSAEVHPKVHIRLLAYVAECFHTIQNAVTPAEVAARALHLTTDTRGARPQSQILRRDVEIAAEFIARTEYLGYTSKAATIDTREKFSVGQTTVKNAVGTHGASNATRMLAVMRAKQIQPERGPKQPRKRSTIFRID